MTVGPGKLKNTRMFLFGGTINPFLKFKKLKEGSESHDSLLLVH